MLQLVEGTNIYRHVITPPYEEYNQMHRCHLRPKHLRQSHPESLQQKVQQAKARPENFLALSLVIPFLFHGCFFCHKKMEPEIFCCRFSVLEVAGTAPKPPQTYAERLQILDRMRMVRGIYRTPWDVGLFPPWHPKVYHLPIFSYCGHERINVSYYHISNFGRTTFFC